MSRAKKAVPPHRHSVGRQSVPRYQKCNASFVMAATRCPLQAFFSIFLELPEMLSPPTVLGTSVHAMFEKSLRRHKSTGRYPFATPKKLIGAWWNYWTTAAFRPTTSDEQKAAHGFGGYGEAWEDVPWSEYPAQPERMREQGCATMAMFFKAFDPIRQSEATIWVERSFAFWWQNIYWTGRIDAIIFEPDGAIIVDHKPYDYTEPVRLTGVQATFYQLAYELYLRRHAPQQMPLKAIRIYNYKSGRFQDVPLRDSHEIGMLVKIAQEITFYFAGVLKGIVPPVEFRREFRLCKFNPLDLERGDISPNFPRDEQCKYCRFIVQCRQWERQSGTTARERYRLKTMAAATMPDPTQIRIPFGDLPVVQRGRNAFERLIIPPAEQIRLDL